MVFGPLLFIFIPLNFRDDVIPLMPDRYEQDEQHQVVPEVAEEVVKD